MTSLPKEFASGLISALGGPTRCSPNQLASDIYHMGFDLDKRTCDSGVEEYLGDCLHKLAIASIWQEFPYWDSQMIPWHVRDELGIAVSLACHTVDCRMSQEFAAIRVRAAIGERRWHLILDVLAYAWQWSRYHRDSWKELWRTLARSQPDTAIIGIECVQSLPESQVELSGRPLQLFAEKVQYSHALVGRCSVRAGFAMPVHLVSVDRPFTVVVVVPSEDYVASYPSRLPVHIRW